MRGNDAVGSRQLLGLGGVSARAGSALRQRHLSHRRSGTVLDVRRFGITYVPVITGVV